MDSPGLQISREIVPKCIHSVNVHVIIDMRQHLKLKAYSASTIKTYLNEMSQFLQAIGHIPANALKPEHLKRYLVYCFEELGLKENTLHSRINVYPVGLKK